MNKNINFNDLPNDIKNIIFKMNRPLDTPEYNEFCCLPLECELRGVDPFIWEEICEWEEMNDRNKWEELCDEGHCDVPFLEWLYL
jgi:hypothetical protein